MTAMTVCGKIRLSFKCIQLLLACVCIGLYANTGLSMHVQAETTLMAITFGGFIIVLAGQILGFITGERCPKKVDLLYTLAGLALFVAAGSVAISRFNSLKAIHAYGSHVQNLPHGSYNSNEGAKYPEKRDEQQQHGYTVNIDYGSLKRVINIGLAMGSIAIINGGFFLFDAILSYKDVHEYTPHQ